MPDVEITRDTWPKLIDVVRKKAGSEQPVWKCVGVYYSVCIVSLITLESREMWQLYQDIGGLKNETFDSYLQLPAPWIAACRVISSEIDRIDRVRQRKVERKSRARTDGRGNKPKRQKYSKA